MNTLRCALFSLAVLVTQSASAEVILCKLDPTPASYYIAPEVRLEVRENSDVLVWDAIIASTDRDRVIGEVSNDDARRLTILWEVRNVATDPREYRAYGSHLLVRLTIQRPGGAARMTILDAQSRRYEYRTVGSCQFGN
jgi:hypothetical protein